MKVVDRDEGGEGYALDGTTSAQSRIKSNSPSSEVINASRRLVDSKAKFCICDTAIANCAGEVFSDDLDFGPLDLGFLDIEVKPLTLNGKEIKIQERYQACDSRTATWSSDVHRGLCLACSAQTYSYVGIPDDFNPRIVQLGLERGFTGFTPTQDRDGALRDEFSILLCDVPVDVTRPPIAGETNKVALNTASSQGSFDVRDKVTDRVLVNQFGDFLQPPFLDARLAQDQQQIICVNMQNCFPPEVVRSIVEQLEQHKVVTFENEFAGFLLEMRNGNLEIYSRNPRVQQSIHSTQKVDNWKERLELFLRDLTEATSPLTIFFKREIGDNSHLGLGAEILAKQICDSPLDLYLKSTRTARGTSVCRIRTTPEGERILESDSEELPEIWDRYFEISSLTGSAHSVNGFLTQLIDRELEAPILEMAIKSERVPSHGIDSCKAEFRMICQGEGDSVEVAGHYAKVSAQEIAGNISLGGWGEKTEDIIRKIYEKHGGGDVDEIERKSSTSYEELLTKTKSFANKLIQHGDRFTHDFAIDLLPVWNEKTGKVDFYLVEIQRGYGCVALQNVDPDAAKRISEFQMAGVFGGILRQMTVQRAKE